MISRCEEQVRCSSSAACRAFASEDSCKELIPSASAHRRDYDQLRKSVRREMELLHNTTKEDALLTTVAAPSLLDPRSASEQMHGRGGGGASSSTLKQAIHIQGQVQQRACAMPHIAQTLLRSTCYGIRLHVHQRKTDPPMFACPGS